MGMIIALHILYKN